jgi:hypothetical protein
VVLTESAVSDRVLALLLKASVIGMITACVFAAMTFLYNSFFDIVGGHAQPAATSFGLACACAVAIWLLCRYRDDLIDI